MLAHGLLGFNELQLAGAWMPRIHYWYGIEEALESRGSQVLTTAVPPSASIEERAQTLSDTISQQLPGQKVNIIAHSMGGLDSRFLISKIQPANFTVASLTTIASPHRGSPVADYIMGGMGPTNVARVRGLLDKFSIPSGAFMQLTRDYMCDQFNSTVLDDPAVKYYSFGAYCKPTLTSVFRQSHRIIADAEGPNDGLVSVDSSIWGEYRGTLVNVSHLDLINWTNQIRWWARENLLGKRRTFNAVAFYLDIAGKRL